MKTFTDKIKFILSYFGIWVGYFIITRVIFIFYHYDKTLELSLISILKTFVYGLKLDLSFTAYLSIIPFLFIALLSWVPPKIVSATIKRITYTFICIINVLLIADVTVYEHWEIRIDSTFLKYLNTPKEMFSSTSYIFLIMMVVIWLIGSMLILYVYNKLMKKQFANFKKGKLWEFPVFIILTASLILIMRGGLQTIPINQSDVYFSNNMFANHAAVNFGWNFMHSIKKKSYTTKNPFKRFDIKTAKQIHREARIPLITKNPDSAKILRTTRPNIILIIWESLTASVVEPLGGEKGVTEHFNQLSKEGILFTNFYANGNRTDKGLAAILSGYYPQPMNSIIKMPTKTKKLPVITQILANSGYTNSFYYGGDLNFANMYSYLQGKDIHHFVDEDDFHDDEKNYKWGAHDHFLFKKVISDSLINLKEPFCNIIMTLTSHEPFEFPGDYKFGKKSKTDKFKSSLVYTDEEFGKFISHAKKQPWWHNTLIVVVADHGHRLPHRPDKKNSGPGRYKIPMLWLGGALAQTGVINNSICSQTDFAYSLLNLIGADNSKFEFGKDIFLESDDHYAHYIFKNGFGTITKNGYVIYDYISKKPVLQSGTFPKKIERLGKAITQTAYQDFLDK